MTPVPGAGASDHQSARVSGNDQVPPPAKRAVAVSGYEPGRAAAGTATSQVVRTDRPPSTRSNVAGEVAVTVQSCAADSAITTRSFGSAAPLCNVVVTVTVVPVSTTRG